MGARENEQRKTLEEYEVDDILRRYLRLPDSAQIIRQTDGTILIIWEQR